jgi:hypothetical protein
MWHLQSSVAAPPFPFRAAGTGSELNPAKRSDPRLRILRPRGYPNYWRIRGTKPGVSLTGHLTTFGGHVKLRQLMSLDGLAACGRVWGWQGSIVAEGGLVFEEREASVHQQRRAGDRFGVIRAEEDGGLGDLLRCL